jgi:hypothetical protein
MKLSALAPVLAILGAVVGLVAGDQPVNADSAIIQDFEKKVADYLQLRKDAESRMPALKATAAPAKITQHQNELARAIRKARGNAKQGDVFTKPIDMEIRRLLHIAMGPVDASHVRQSLRQAEPVQLELHVGDAYPPHLPLQSTPPTILGNLPKLPPEIEYRITGRDLVLIDTKANLIIDLIDNAFS